MLTITCARVVYICAELSSGLRGNARIQDLHDVSNALYDELNQSNPHYCQMNSSDTSTGHVYETPTSAVAQEELPYETPAPLGALNAEKIKN